MNIALSIDTPHLRANPGPLSSSGPIAHVEIFDDLASAEPIWRHLERDDAVKTPYQSFDLLASWQRHIGAANEVAPCLVVGFDASDDPAFLWPMGRTRTGPVQVLTFLGGKHANFNFGVWRRDILASITADDMC